MPRGTVEVNLPPTGATAKQKLHVGNLLGPSPDMATLKVGVKLERGTPVLFPFPFLNCRHEKREGVVTGPTAVRNKLGNVPKTGDFRIRHMYSPPILWYPNLVTAFNGFNS